MIVGRTNEQGRQHTVSADLGIGPGAKGSFLAAMRFRPLAAVTGDQAVSAPRRPGYLSLSPR